jgi:hypothetical protein
MSSGDNVFPNGHSHYTLVDAIDGTFLPKEKPEGNVPLYPENTNTKSEWTPISTHAEWLSVISMLKEGGRMNKCGKWYRMNQKYAYDEGHQLLVDKRTTKEVVYYENCFDSIEVVHKKCGLHW